VIVNYSEYIYVCVIVGNYDCDSWGRFGERARESKRNGKRKGKKIIGDEDRTVVGVQRVDGRHHISTVCNNTWY
jgi:hypothetical protein